MFSFKCPICGKQLTSKEEWCGQETICSSCSNKIVIPNAEDVAPDVVEQPKNVVPQVALAATENKKATVSLLSILSCAFAFVGILEIVFFVLCDLGYFGGPAINRTLSMVLAGFYFVSNLAALVTGCIALMKKTEQDGAGKLNKILAWSGVVLTVLSLISFYCVCRWEVKKNEKLEKIKAEAQAVDDKVNEQKKQAESNRDSKINEIMAKRDAEIGKIEEEIKTVEAEHEVNNGKLQEEGAAIEELSRKIEDAEKNALENKERLSYEFENSAKGKEAITKEMDRRSMPLIENCPFTIADERFSDMLKEVYGGYSVADLRKHPCKMSFEEAILQYETVANENDHKWFEDFKTKYPRITKGLNTTIREVDGSETTGVVRNFTSDVLYIKEAATGKVSKVEIRRLDYKTKQRLNDEAKYDFFVNEEYRAYKSSKRKGQDADNIKFKLLLKSNYIPVKVMEGTDFLKIPEGFFNSSQWIAVDKYVDKFYRDSFKQLSEEYVTKNGFHFVAERGIWLPDDFDALEENYRAHKRKEASLQKKKDDLLGQKTSLENKIKSINNTAAKEIAQVEREFKYEMRDIEEEYETEANRIYNEAQKEVLARIRENMKNESPEKRFKKMCKCIEGWLACQRDREDGLMYTTEGFYMTEMYNVADWEILSDSSVCKSLSQLVAVRVSVTAIRSKNGKAEEGVLAFGMFTDDGYTWKIKSIEDDYEDDYE